jgi:hypothetical protein
MAVVTKATHAQYEICDSHGIVIGDVMTCIQVCSSVSEEISPITIRIAIHPDILEEPATSIITLDTYPFKSSKMSVHFYQNTKCHIPENGSLHIQ